MKIVKIWGGLGNQLFQYALYRTLLKAGQEVYVDLSWFSNENRKFFYPNQLPQLGLLTNELKKGDKYYHKGIEFELLRLSSSRSCAKIFYLIYFLLRLGKGKLKCINENLLYSYAADVIRSDNIYLTGYWQNEKYFYDVLSDIVKEICFEINLNMDMEKLIEEIKSSNAVSLHIRRNDYEFENFEEICSDKYYLESIQYFRKQIVNPIFFIFSNNMDLAKKVIGVSKDFVYVEVNDRNHGLGDLLLMSLCKYNIISSSTFGWWGATLNQHADKLVIYPKKWIAREKNLNIIPDGWIGI